LHLNKWLVNKKKAVIATTLALVLSVPTIASAAQEGSTDQSLVPLRTIAQSLGAQVAWVGATKTITVERDSTTIELNVGDTKATIINGRAVTLEQEPRMIDSRIYVPRSFIKMAFQGEVKWNADNQSVSLENDDFANRASAFVHLLLQGNTGTITKEMSGALKQSLPEQTLGLFSQQISAMFGQPNKRLSAIVNKNLVHTNVNLVYKTAQASFEIIVRFNTADQIDDLNVQPAAPPITFTKPLYDQGNYSEQQVVIGEGTFALPGTLTVPQGEGPFPAIILVHGSGPHDQDSTIGGTKVFKDLAVGLASQGIAVLRYEKISREHTAKVSTNQQFTLKNESVDDVIKALELLNNKEEIDSSRMFVAGHSQGGYVMPMIIDNAKKELIAGVILLSAPSEQFTDVLIEQQKVGLERLQQLGLPAEIIAQQERAVAIWTSIADLVQNSEYSKDNPPANFPIPPAYWWYEQRDYVPAELAIDQAGRTLILQGENDWQVSMKQYEGWKNAFKHRSDVTFISYPKVNHLLTEYDGLSVGMEYGAPAHVSQSIINDIVEWLKE
jgi:predicted alpha/beta-hydrolase family hydrolase